MSGLYGTLELERVMPSIQVSFKTGFIAHSNSSLVVMIVSICFGNACIRFKTPTLLVSCSEVHNYSGTISVSTPVSGHSLCGVRKRSQEAHCMVNTGRPGDEWAIHTDRH